jgi:hypothetical protein
VGVVYEFRAVKAWSPKGFTGLNSDFDYICNWMAIYYRGGRTSRDLGFQLICAKLKPNWYYTSKASFLDADLIPVMSEKPAGWNPTGKRVKRGLYSNRQGG